MDNIQAIKSHLGEYMAEVGATLSKAGGKDMYTCPLCGSGVGGADGKRHTGAFHYEKNNQVWKCHSCGRGGTIIDLYGYIEGINAKDSRGFKRIIQALEDKYNIEDTSSFVVSAKEDFKDIPTPEEQAERDYIEEEINLCIGACEHTVGFSDYLTNRGISLEVQRRFNIGYFGEWLHPKTKYRHFGKIKREWLTPRIIIPTSDKSYLARATTPEPPENDPRHKYYVKAYKVGEVNIFNSNALTSSDYCFIVEGEIDALSCIECGYNAVGLGSVTMIEKLFNNYEINKDIVLLLALDNDEAGQDNLQKLISQANAHGNYYIPVDSNFLFDGAKDCNDALQKDKKALIEHLEHYKQKALDLDKSTFFESSEGFQGVGTNTTVAHHNGNGNNSTSSNVPELPPYIKEKINEKTGELTYTLNCEILADVIRKKHDFILVKYANDRQSKPDFYLYEHGVYRIKNLDELRAFIKAYFLEPYKYYNSSFVDTKNITKVCNSLYTDYFKFVDSTQLNNNENIINFRNGLLYLDSMTLKPHTPSIYSTIQIDCDYNPNATNCPIFSDYINTLTNNNENVKRVILEVMGIAISNIKGHKMKMALFTIGKGDTGKSQIRLLTNKLIGFENTSGIDLDTLEERFGTSAIYQKRVIGSADMGFMNVKQLRTFKQITGGDGINCEFKGGAFFSYIFDGVVWFSANEMPRFGGDKGDWVYGRMIIVKCDNVIPKDKQDKNLVEKMMKEAPAIINILLSYVKDVITNGYEYHVPEECKLAREQYKKENSLVQTFLDECTEPRKSYDCCTTKKMYDVFKAWCSDNARGYTPTNQEFRKELVNIYKVSDIKELEKKSPKGNRYYPFALTLSTKQDYIKAYGYDSIYNEQ